MGPVFVATPPPGAHGRADAAAEGAEVPPHGDSGPGASPAAPNVLAEAAHAFSGLAQDFRTHVQEALAHASGRVAESPVLAALGAAMRPAIMPEQAPSAPARGLRADLAAARAVNIGRELLQHLHIPSAESIMNSPLDALGELADQNGELLAHTIHQARDLLQDIAITGRKEKDLETTLGTHQSPAAQQGRLWALSIPDVARAGGRLAVEFTQAVERAIKYATDPDEISTRHGDTNPGGIIVLRTPTTGGYENMEQHGGQRDPGRVSRSQVAIGPENWEKVFAGVIRQLGRYPEVNQEIGRRREAEGITGEETHPTERQVEVYNDTYYRRELALRFAVQHVAAQILELAREAAHAPSDPGEC